MKAWLKMALWKKILIGIGLGLIVGMISPAAAEALSPLGDIFLRLLKMLIIPLVFFSITSGICKMGDARQLRVVGARYVLWIVVSAIIAAALGMVVALIAQPGRSTTEFLAASEAAQAANYSFIDNVVGWFPSNIVEAAYNTNMLQIIVFCLFLGVALLSLGEKVAKLIEIIDQMSNATLKITEYVMELSPIGIFSLIATMVSTVSGAMMREVLYFIVLDNLACLLLLIAYPFVIKALSGLAPMHFMKKIAPAMLVAISTTSSAATLPVSIKVSEEELGIPENIYGFTLPLGNTCGMTGFAIYLGMMCVFASNLYGFEVSFGSMVRFLLLGLVLSIGAAGVKGAGVVMSTVLLEALGMPLTLIPILAAVWPTIDPAHTLLNNVGDLAGTAVIAKRLGVMNMDVFDNKKSSIT